MENKPQQTLGHQKQENFIKSTKVDSARIIEHYKRLRQRQQQALSKINMSQAMKKQYFGFSENYYYENCAEQKKLVIVNHPLKGKIVMEREKFLLQQKNQERDDDLQSENIFFTSVNRQKNHILQDSQEQLREKQ